MPHRDDREALNAKLEAQARELAETKEELERLRASNVRKATEVERLRAFLPGGAAFLSGGAAPSGVPDALRRQVGVLVIAASILVGGLSFSAIHLAAGSRAGCHGHRPAAPVAATTTPVHAVFGASIARASGVTSHEPGEACRIDATFASDGVSRVHPISALTVTCGEETLYAPSASALADAFGVAWASETDGDVRYELSLVNGDARLESWDGRAVLASGGSRIELALDPLSDEVSLPLTTEAPIERVMLRAGHVTTSTAVAVGTACVVARRPAIVDGFASRVVVRCGDQTLYGAEDTGYTYASDDARLVVDAEGSAVDGDARMTLDLVRGRVHLDDGVGLMQVTVDIELEPTGPTTEI